MTTSDSVRPLTAAEEKRLRWNLASGDRVWSSDEVEKLLASLDVARAGSLDAATLAKALDRVEEAVMATSVRIGRDTAMSDYAEAILAALREAQP